ncbi:MAG: class A beta-lactamase [Legionellales bacterium]|nr:class A beta-lactamase [Legionellales bacterium]
MRFKLVTGLLLFFISTIIFAKNTQNQSIQEKLATLEASSGGRLGISAIDTANNMHIQYHATDRFPMCSTFKVMDVAAILKKSERNPHLLQQTITYTKSDIVGPWNPVTEKHLASGMSVSDLCEAATTQSDDTAANLLMKQVGDPQAVTAFARSIGDNTFRLDRWEPELNTAIPGDLRDTTTPEAMTISLQKLVFGNALALPQREQLQTWLKGTTTGHFRIRAGVPKGWIVGDKTGGGNDYGVTNDIGVIWPPHCSPIVVTIFFTQNKKDAPHREDIVASATRILISEFERTDQCLKQATAK